MDNALIKIQQLLRTPLRKNELGNPKAATQGLSNSLLLLKNKTAMIATNLLN